MLLEGQLPNGKLGTARLTADGYLIVEAAPAASGPAAATEATQLAVKAAVDAVKNATDEVKASTDAGTTSTNATTVSVNAANTAIVAAIVAAGNGKATTADITALAATITATTLDEKNAIVAALLPLAGVQANTAATVNALATVNLNLAALIGATNTNDAAMLAAITATRDNVASAHTDAQAQLAEEQTQTALMVINNAKLEAVRALAQASRDIAAQARDKLTDDPSTEFTLKKLLLSQNALTDSLLQYIAKDAPPQANKPGTLLVHSGETKEFKRCKRIHVESMGSDIAVTVNGKASIIPKNKFAEWEFDGVQDGAIKVTPNGDNAFVVFTTF